MELAQNFSVDDTGDIQIVDDNILLVTGRDVFVQAFRQILQTRKGEYFLNSTEGLDFSYFLGVKNPDLDDMQDAIIEAASQIEDFIQFIELDFDFNQQTRILTITFLAQFMDEEERAQVLEVSLIA